jgi:hypothetical protein
VAVAAAGYSGTPLQKKLGFKPGMTAVYLDAPDHLDELLGELECVAVKRALRGHADLVMCFVTERRALERRAARLRSRPTGWSGSAGPRRPRRSRPT